MQQLPATMTRTLVRRIPSAGHAAAASSGLPGALTKRQWRQRPRTQWQRYDGAGAAVA